MVDVVDLGGALCGKTGNHHGCTSAKIIGPHRRTSQCTNALNNGNFAIHLDSGTHPLQLIGITITIVPDGFCNQTGSLGQAEADHQSETAYQLESQGREGS